MIDKLVIVESPAKANTIKKFLGGNSKVVASMGHIRDLPKSKLGVDIEHDFEPQYINIRGKAPLINSLKKDAKEAKKVLADAAQWGDGELVYLHAIFGLTPSHPDFLSTLILYYYNCWYYFHSYYNYFLHLILKKNPKF